MEKTENKKTEQTAENKKEQETKKKDRVIFGRKITIEKVEKASKEKKEKEPGKKLSKGQIAGIAAGVGTAVGVVGKVAFDIFTSRNAEHGETYEENTVYEIPAEESAEAASQDETVAS